MAQQNMTAAHIIPFFIRNFDVNATGGPFLVRDDVLLFSPLTYLQRQKNAACTRDMFQSWTQIDIRTVLTSDINSPGNTIYMTREEQESFGNFDFYFDKEAVSCFQAVSVDRD
jgi:hypothetical protein